MKTNDMLMDWTLDEIVSYLVEKDFNVSIEERKTLDRIGDFFNNLGTMIDNYNLAREVKRTYKKEKK